MQALGVAGDAQASRKRCVEGDGEGEGEHGAERLNGLQRGRWGCRLVEGEGGGQVVKGSSRALSCPRWFGRQQNKNDR